MARPLRIHARGLPIRSRYEPGPKHAILGRISRATGGTVSVVSYLKLVPKPEFQTQFEQNLQELLGLVRQQAGFVQVEVLRPADDASAYVILSEWESEAAFKTWEHSARHQVVMDNYNQRAGQGYTTMRLNRYR
ncbi:MAG: antibiotic biosynthesis monooxygenase [Dehalococcoidia bacterium]|nr:antibiotic biosynthesis monooxygenase [Dehalococcoidia bacterium]